jgi:hypothetical protein
MVTRQPWLDGDGTIPVRVAAARPGSVDPLTVEGSA